jgi:hypothetical protein
VSDENECFIIQPEVHVFILGVTDEGIDSSGLTLSLLKPPKFCFQYWRGI